MAARRAAAEGWLPAIDELASLLRLRYIDAGDPADLVEAHHALRTAADSLPPGHPARAVLLNNLSPILRDRFQLTGDLAFLHEALDATPAEPAPMAMNRVETLRLLAERTEAPEPLAEADALARGVLAGLSDADPMAANVRESLAELNRLRYVRSNDLALLTEAADLAGRSLRDTPADHPRHLSRVTALGNILQLTALHTGDEDTRENAIRLLRSVLDQTSPTYLDRPNVLTDLAVALCDRGRHTDDLAALHEGVGLMRAALDATPREHGSWANRCENFLLAALSLVERTQDVKLMDEMVAIGRAAIARGGREATIHMLVAAVLRQRFGQTGRTEDLLTALAGLEIDVPYGDADHVALLGNRGQLWLSLYAARGEPEDLRRAVSALGAAVRASPPDLPIRADCLLAYADALAIQFAGSNDPAVRRSAGAAYREAAHISGHRPMARLIAARAWGETEAEAGSWPAAHEAYDLAVRLLPLAVSRRLARTDQEWGLGRLDGLAADAAACALHAGDPEAALQLLELARGVLLSQATQGRDDLARLADEHPALADEIVTLLERLGPADPLTGAAADERHDLDLRLRRRLAEARELPGFGDLLGPSDPADLYACAADGPVVLINVSDHRSDALIVRPAGVQVVALPGLTPATAAERLNALVTALTVATVAGPGERYAQDAVAEVLDWLGGTVVGPVLDHLPEAAGVRKPRVWWSPVGVLALLPVHAAAMDRVVSSYTPTVRALRRARARPPAPGPTLVVAMAETPAWPALPGADREARAVAGLTRSTVLSGPAATFDSVRQALTRHPSMHFAGHAVADPADPSASRLLLQDHQDRPLTVRDIADLDLPNARLAVLSACETSAGSPRLPDEALHLASAFQLAGYPEVVGTLWPINDRVARDIAVDLHSALAGGADAASALHAAVDRCRARYPGTPTLWAAYVHSGR